MKNKKVYIIGIGGISLSALAVLLRDRGCLVRGSDMVCNERVETLRKKGFEIVIGHCKEYVEWADEIIYTSALSDEDEDLVLARKSNKKVISRAEALGELSRHYKTISVAGCHGKTTTTGLISSIFLQLKEKPNIHIGGILNQIHDNVCEGKSDVFITEACEYKDSFLAIDNYVAVILNIKPDHLDYFKTFDNVKKSFACFAENVRKNGKIIINGDDLSCREIVQKHGEICYTFGLSQSNDYSTKNVVEYENGKYMFDCFFKNQFFLQVKLPLYGAHNILNALASIAVANFFGVEKEVIKKGIESFEGIARRFEKVYADDNKLIIHDYAHHPDEIKASIEAGRKIKKRRIIVAFQPHTFTRTRDFFDGFVSSLSLADEVWLLPIYPAREKPIKGVNSRKIYEKIKENGKKTRYFKNFDDIFDEIKSVDDNSLVLILGAGDIEEVANRIKNLHC